MLDVAGGIIVAVIVLAIIGKAAQYFAKRKATEREFTKSIKEMEEMKRFVNDPEHIKPWKLLQLKCRAAEGFYRNDMKSMVPQIQERAAPQLEECIQSRLADVHNVNDEFCKSAMLHAIARLMWNTGQLERGGNLIELIAVGVIRENALEELRNMGGSVKATTA